MKIRSIPLVVLLLFTLIACQRDEPALENGTSPDASPAAPATGGAQSPLTLQMQAQNNSGQSGTATLTPEGDGVRVVLNITGSAAGPQPAHIHAGTCANLGQVRHPLTDVSNGTSETTVAVKLSDLLSGEFAINVHKSSQELSVYVSCADIKQ